MARFLVFDTMAVNDSVNNLGPYSRDTSVWNTPGLGATGENLKPITPWIDWAGTYANAYSVLSYPAGMADNVTDIAEAWNGASYPARLFGGSEPVDRISWEFYLTGEPGAIDVCWYQEFNNERAVPFTWTSRHMEPLPAKAPWVREQVESIANTGLVTHTNLVRSMTMNTGGAFNGLSDSRIFPMLVHGQWVRLRVFSMTALGLSPNYYQNCAAYSPAQRLRIYAVVGGYEQVAAMDPSAAKSLLWDSTVVNGTIVWDTNNPGQSLGYIGSWPTW